jgi:CRISPR-associated protein Cas2
MFYLICYDIVNDRRRTKIAYLLESYGMRIQQSVFECVLDDKQYEVLNQKLMKLINKKEDQLRFYPLSKSCRSQVAILGIKPTFSVDSSTFIV